MTNNHTPGPWYEYDEDGTWFIYTEERVNVAFTDPTPTEVSKDEDHANARLIAASPDLLEAAIEVIQRCDSPSTYPIMKKSIEQLKAAIAKATGGTDDETA